MQFSSRTYKKQSSYANEIIIRRLIINHAYECEELEKYFYEFYTWIEFSNGSNSVVEQYKMNGWKNHELGKKVYFERLIFFFLSRLFAFDLRYC